MRDIPGGCNTYSSIVTSIYKNSINLLDGTELSYGIDKGILHIVTNDPPWHPTVHFIESDYMNSLPKINYSEVKTC
jgi:hypothetical protein